MSTDQHPGSSGSGETSTLARLNELQDKVDNLLLALASQRLIGTAVGLVAARASLPTGEAWDLLSRMSQDSNLKVRDVARVLVDSHDGTSRPGDAELLARLKNRPT